MAFSRITYSGDGSTTVFPVPFDYMSRKHITVLLDGQDAAFTWKTSNEVALAKTPPSGSKVLIARSTPIDVPPVDFKEGALITANDLDVIASYYLFVAQESQDKSADVTPTVINNNTTIINSDPASEIIGGTF